jgi:hypothetical protein
VVQSELLLLLLLLLGGEDQPRPVTIATSSLLAPTALWVHHCLVVGLLLLSRVLTARHAVYEASVASSSSSSSLAARRGALLFLALRVRVVAAPPRDDWNVHPGSGSDLLLVLLLWGKLLRSHMVTLTLLLAVLLLFVRIWHQLVVVVAMLERAGRTHGLLLLGLPEPSGVNTAIRKRLLTVRIDLGRMVLLLLLLVLLLLLLLKMLGRSVQSI